MKEYTTLEFLVIDAKKHLSLKGPADLQRE